jgi:hypothetical protein
MPMTASPARYGAKEPAAIGNSGNASQDDRAGRRRLHVRVWQPRMERDERHLDRKGQRERQEQPELDARRQRQILEPHQVETEAAGRGLMQVAERDDGDEHQDAPRHRVEDELDGRVDALVVPPDPDEEVHRDEHGVPEHVEEKEVEGDEDPDHRALEEQEEGRELPHPRLNGLPRREERNRRQEPGEDDQQEADAVHAHQVLDAEGRDPGVALHELVARLGRREAVPEQERLRKDHDRHEEREAPDEPVPLAVAIGHAQQHEGPGERHEHERGQYREVHPQLSARGNSPR